VNVCIDCVVVSVLFPVSCRNQAPLSWESLDIMIMPGDYLMILRWLCLCRGITRLSNLCTVHGTCILDKCVWDSVGTSSVHTLPIKVGLRLTHPPTSEVPGVNKT
jgi:hypothetical protein